MVRSLLVRTGTETMPRHGTDIVHGPATDNTVPTAVRSHRAGRSIKSRKLSVIKCVKKYTHGRTRQGTYMYCVVYDWVHICTVSYTTAYIYVLCRIRLRTYMYPVVYDCVHICTVSYMAGYIYVLRRIRLGTYMYSVYTSRYMYVPTRSTYGEVDPFCVINWDWLNGQSPTPKSTYHYHHL